MDSDAFQSLGDLCIRITKGTTPTTLGRQFTATGINFVKVESITNDGQFLISKFDHIDEETDRLLARSRLNEGDIVFTIAGTIGRVGLVGADILPANTNQAVAIIRPDSSKLDGTYLAITYRVEPFVITP